VSVRFGRLRAQACRNRDAGAARHGGRHAAAVSCAAGRPGHGCPVLHRAGCKGDTHMPNNSGTTKLNAIRFSLCLKAVVVGWAFYYALRTDDVAVSLLYLVVSIVFAGLFVFQLDFYRRSKTEQDKR
jgi:hypothetical protein